MILSSTSDARFQLAREPLDYALSSALASVDQLDQLGRGPEPGARPSTGGA